MEGEIMCHPKTIDSIEAFVVETKKDYEKWDIEFPWFRGEPTKDTPLVPRLYRGDYENVGDFENRLLQYFRIKAPSFWYANLPDRDHIDRWLFLAQHVRLPTRLLDWTEGSLIAFYFALKEKEPIVWMLNPFELNRLPSKSKNPQEDFNIHGLTWYDPTNYVCEVKKREIIAQAKKEKRIPECFIPNIAFENITGAWSLDRRGIQFPVAILPTNVHPRMTAQRSCFTVHGKDKRSLFSILSETKRDDIIKKYVFDIKDENQREAMLDELRILGISQATILPELEGLAYELTQLFRPDLVNEKQK